MRKVGPGLRPGPTSLDGLVADGEAGEHHSVRLRDAVFRPSC